MASFAKSPLFIVVVLAFIYGVSKVALSLPPAAGISVMDLFLVGVVLASSASGIALAALKMNSPQVILPAMKQSSSALSSFIEVDGGEVLRDLLVIGIGGVAVPNVVSAVDRHFLVARADAVEKLNPRVILGYVEGLPILSPEETVPALMPGIHEAVKSLPRSSYNRKRSVIYTGLLNLLRGELTRRNLNNLDLLIVNAKRATSEREDAAAGKKGLLRLAKSIKRQEREQGRLSAFFFGKTVDTQDRELDRMRREQERG